MAAKKTEKANEAEETDADRRPRGYLELDIKRVTDKLESGQLELPEGKHATPHVLAKLLKDEDQLEKAPSSGAVANILKRWRDCGFALVNEKPFYFKGYSAKGREKGLEALRDSQKEKNKAARKAQKDAEKSQAQKEKDEKKAGIEKRAAERSASKESKS